MALEVQMGEDGARNSDDALFAEASRWFFRLAADDVSVDDRQQFSAWLDANPAHRAAWNDVRALMGDLKTPARAAYAGSRRQRPHTALQGQASSAKARWIGVALASVLALAGYFEGPMLFDRLRADVFTLAGQRQTVTLADGTRVELDADTALKVEMSNTARRVVLLRGEAFFDVAKEQRPFAIGVGTAELRDIGTAFAVNKTNDHATAAVESGIVDARIASSSANAVRITAGQKVEIDAQTVSPARLVNIEDELAWRRGQVVFRQMRLSEVVTRLNRYRQGRIVIVNPWISNQLVSGAFHIDDPAMATEALEGVLGVSVLNITPYLTVLR